MREVARDRAASIAAVRTNVDAQGMMRKALKFLHSFAACGFVGSLLAYAVVLIYAPQDSVRAVADMRHTISALCNYLLLPSMAIALITGLLSMVVHISFQEQRWVWLKALLGISVFEATLGIVGSKANYAAALSEKITDKASADALASHLASEWWALGAIMSLSIANIALGVWRPSLYKKNTDGLGDRR